MPLGDCIRSDVVTASPDKTVDEIACMMENENVGSVIITKNDRPIGIVTDRDLALRIAAKGRDSRKTAVREIMTKDPFVVSKDDTLCSVVERARDCGVRRMPVVDSNKKLVGIITMDDVLRLLSQEMGCVTDIIGKAGPSAR